MKIRSHSESHIVELEDGSRWQIFPGDLDLTLDWKPETELIVVEAEDEVATHELVGEVDELGELFLTNGSGAFFRDSLDKLIDECGDILFCPRS